MIYDKNKIGLILSFSLIISIFIISVFLPSTELIYISENIIVLLFYLTLVILMWIEKDHLDEFHIDIWTLIICIISGTFLHKRLGFPGENYFILFQWICSGIILIEVIIFFRKIPRTKFRWVIFGVLLAFIILIPILTIESIQANYWLKQISYTKENLILVVIRKIIYEFSWVAPFEEILFRGLFWGYLIRLGWREEKIFWYQGILFWLMHVSQIFNPITYFITIPLSVFTCSILVRRSRQLFPSIIAHTIINTFIPILIYVIWG